MNPDLDRLLDYPFERLRRLLAGVRPPAGVRPIALTIGEPQHPPPAFVIDELVRHSADYGRYPPTAGIPELRAACAAWAERRFALGKGAIDPQRQVLPVAGTREALFAFAQAVVDRSRPSRVVMPNPFYQIYEGAALLSGSQPEYVPCAPQCGWRAAYANVPADIWAQCQLLYVCSPANPTGAVLSESEMRELIDLSDEYGFVIAADECYSEIYADEASPPGGFLAACHAAGRSDFRNVVVFHSLSKRSNLPGLRSGFVAGDADVLDRFLKYRTYQGAALPLPTQKASITAWGDEAHVVAGRALYRQKFARVAREFADHWPIQIPAATFYVWAAAPGGDDCAFARELYAATGVSVLPGSYLSRRVGGQDPGAGWVRLSLVESPEVCADAARRITAFLAGR